ncbi:sigma-54-dependent Fis family transcriptional regulator [bacterium]|nr:sigma-54-dependent Fis family transcriptional regulator [bacterium]
MINKRKILIVDDDLELSESLADILDFKSYDVHCVGNGNDALEFVQQQCPALVLLDLLLPGLNGIEILERIQAIDPAIIVIMMSGHGSIETAVKATQVGAYDWLEKPLEKERLLLAVRNALEKSMLLREREALLCDAQSRYRMVGVSQSMKYVFQFIDRVAPQRSTVFITGESGTGKEMVAQAIHQNSPRADAPFVSVNCAAIPENLIESELFGHRKGAFTGAHDDKKGKFMLAHGGTLFLDEIGDLSLNAQAKLLRTLEMREVEVVGGTKALPVDVRILCATNKDLRSKIADGLFREDLFYRIHVIDIQIPALRERPEDILPLMDHFLSASALQNNIKRKLMTQSAEVLLLAHAWPGNAREMRNLAEKMTVLLNDDQVSGTQVAQLLQSGHEGNLVEELMTYKHAREIFDRGFIQMALSRYNNNVTRTAESLDLTRSVLYDKIKRCGLAGGSGFQDG